MWAAANKKLSNPRNIFLWQNRIWNTMCSTMSCQQGSYLFILPGIYSSPVGTIWKSCRLNLLKIVACLSCIKHQFIEFVCVVCCSIDNLKVKETVGVDVVFSSCTKTRLKQAVNGWVSFGLPPKCFVRFCTAGTGRLTLAFRKSTSVLSWFREGLYVCWPWTVWHLELGLPVWDLLILCRHYSWGDYPQQRALVASASLQPRPELFSLADTMLNLYNLQ